MAANHPGWQHVGFNANQHPEYTWTDPQGNTHLLTGFIGRGNQKAPIQRVGPKLSTLARRCENGSCGHVFSAPAAEIPTPDEIAAAQAAEASTRYQPGTQVMYQGAPWWVTAYADGIYQLNNDAGDEDLASHEELAPLGHIANILDPVRNGLDPLVFDDATAPDPRLKPELQAWLTQTIFEVLERHGYTKPEAWLTLVLTGSLTTYQYSDASDCDISLFVDSKKFPDWSRAEMIAIMVKDLDTINLPGTPHPLQGYVVPAKLRPQDLYKPGLRSGLVVYGKKAGKWLVPPDRTRVHDVEHEMNDAYTVGLLSADKLDLLLRFEPAQAVEYWHSLHKARAADQTAGKGDFETSNIVFKMLVNRGLAAKAATLAGDTYIPG